MVWNCNTNLFVKNGIASQPQLKQLNVVIRRGQVHLIFEVALIRGV
jgi:hypothetical protein